MQVDSLHWSVDCRQPALVAVLGVWKKLVELPNDLGDTAEDDTLGRSKATVGSTRADKASNERQQVDRLHVEARCINIQGDLALEGIHLGQVRFLGPKIDDVVRFLRVYWQELIANLVAYLRKVVVLSSRSTRGFAFALSQRRVVVSAHPDRHILSHALIDAVPYLCVLLAHV
jgi:hypothetical protein